MSQFGKEAEDRLINWMRQVQGAITGGDHPTQAIVKVARDNQVTSDMLPLLVQAYNTGQQTYQRDKCGAAGEGVLCKVAEFPLASIEDVREALYPEKVAAPVDAIDPTSISDEYSRPPAPFLHDVSAAREKVASATVRMVNPPKPLESEDPDIKMAKVFGKKDRIEQRVKLAQQDQRMARTSFLLSLGNLGDYFKQAEYARLPMQEVGFNAIAMYGEAAGDALRYAAHRNNTDVPDFTRAPKIARPVDPNQAPYSLVKTAIDRCRVAIAAAQTVDQTEKTAAAETEALLRPFVLESAETPTRVLDTPWTWKPKRASIWSSLTGGLVGGTASGSARGLFAPPPTDSLVDSAEMNLSDPQHLDELKQIESKAILNDMLANDEVISGYDPEEVSAAYNEIIATSPSMSTQPLALRPMLRKRLSAGSMEPFEAQQAAELEKTVQQSQGGSGGGQRSTPTLV